MFYDSGLEIWAPQDSQNAVRFGLYEDINRISETEKKLKTKAWRYMEQTAVRSQSSIRPWSLILGLGV
jgi:hypothetical protein